MTAELTDLAGRVRRVIAVPRDEPDDEALAAAVAFTGPRTVLPAYFDVTGLAAASVAAASLAAAEFLAARDYAAGGQPARARQVSVDTRAACAAFACEALFTPVGWSLPDLRDPVAGNYRAQDGWIRLHTNYAYHRAVVEKLLGARDRDAVAAAVRGWKAGDLEIAVVEAGGCAAAMRDRDAWLASPPGRATAEAPALTVAARPLPAGASARPLQPLPPLAAGAGRGRRGHGAFGGIRVLDLTRVIAGPVCTRFLAAYGADVLRVDPPGFAEVPALLPETTAGKRTTALDLTALDRTGLGDRAVFETLVAGADVLVTGLRADALGRLGYDDAALAEINPGLIIASLDAYGWDGPWRDRRGFDSLVQMSCGIAAAGAAVSAAMAAGRDEPVPRPVPLPVQALDHATGYLLAAAVGRALTRRLTRPAVTRIRASLVGTANLLWSLPVPEGPLPSAPGPGDFALENTTTAWGPARRVPLPGRIDGIDPSWRVEPGSLGRHEPAWPD